MAPYAQLLANPLVGSVAVVEMADIAKSGLPPLPTGGSTHHTILILHSVITSAPSHSSCILAVAMVLPTPYSH